MIAIRHPKSVAIPRLLEWHKYNGVPSLRQTRHALKLQDKPQRHSHVNRFNLTKRRGVELLFDMLPRRSLAMTVGQMTLGRSSGPPHQQNIPSIGTNRPPSPTTQSRQFGAIRNEPGNLCLHGDSCAHFVSASCRLDFTCRFGALCPLLMEGQRALMV
jgi:hypothetical protein